MWQAGRSRGSSPDIGQQVVEDLQPARRRDARALGVEARTFGLLDR